MNRRLLIWSLTAVLLLISLPGLYERWKTELDNDTYEFILPYQEIYDLTTSGKMPPDEAFSTLEESGLTTVSLRPDNLSRLESQNIIDMYSQEELEKLLKFSGIEDKYTQEEKGFYISVPEYPYHKERIKKAFDPLEVEINGQKLYFIQDEEGDKTQQNLGYNQVAIDVIKENDLNYILRLENEEDPEKNQQTIEEVIDLKDEDFSTVLFSGIEVIGYPDISQLKEWTERLDEAGLGFYMIEMANQKGLQTAARETGYDIIRLHSLSLGPSSIETNVDKTVRAVKERNIRAIFFHLPNGVPEDSLEAATEYLRTSINEMPNQFKTGEPEPFKPIETPWWVEISLLAASVLFIYLAASSILPPKLGIAAAAFMILLMIAYLAIGQLLVLKAVALIVAIATPIYAVTATSEGTTKINRLTWQYVKAIGVSFTGIAIVTGLLNGIAFITGFELFRGVKLVYIIPLVFMVIFVLWDKVSALLHGRMLGKVWNTSVKYGHLFVIGLLAFAVYYYISRTGNSGSVLEIEILIRQKLEEFLYVRPRTKEFLIGFPFYLLALYVMGINRKWGILLLIPGVIGFLSMMNTFTHFHIPLYLSLLRTIYSLIFGYIIGLLMIYIFKICFRYISKVLTTRWS